ncbi:MAG: hypothetical protein A3E01_17760 [Gammaproteobacteria bacterium RIFCSPHIGHO2_12_FULL_63_22]|nr:MAG: hypothetical protein A3E01_17760 [Gammaproteobacteria bacterium RIFCSPHIGHO2_12_FULL_63_22]
MTSPAQTVRVFGGYLIALAAVLIVAPNLLLEAFGMAPVTDVWIRVTGMLVGFLGVYYLRAAKAGLTEFFAWTVSVRLSVFLFFSAFVLLKLAPPVLLVFAIVDAAAAIWTRQCLKSSGVN